MPLDLVWRARLGTVNCPTPACPAVDPQIALSDGDLWMVASVQSASNRTVLGDAHVGFLLSRFDVGGNSTFSSVTDLGTRLSLPLPSVKGLGGSGGPMWLAPTRDRRGLEVRRHDSLGQLVQRWPVVDSAIAGEARWDKDGSSVVIHTHEAANGGAREGGTPTPLRSVDISRFGAKGQLFWNRASVVSAAPTTLRTVLADTDVQGDSTLAIRDAGEAGLRILRLDRDGNVAWAREIEGAEGWDSGSTAVDSEGAVLSLYTSTAPDMFGNQATFAQRVAPDGEPSWRARLGDLNVSAAGLQSVLGAAVDSQGRWIVLGATLSGDGLSLLRLSADGTACTLYSVDIPDGVLAADGTSTSSNGNVSVAFGNEGEIHVATTVMLGTARFP